MTTTRKHNDFFYMMCRMYFLAQSPASARTFTCPHACSHTKEELVSHHRRDRVSDLYCNNGAYKPLRIWVITITNLLPPMMVWFWFSDPK